jgi:GNAT superfamily N-acetyltransferase
MGPAKSIKVRPLTRADWPVVDQLFGANGACGGCWCMTWRVPRGGKLWEECKGEKNKRVFRKLVMSGAVHACLAFADDEPVGWCCIGPRGDFPRLERIKALATDWNEHTWSVTCFFIRAPWRGRGVATKLLRAAAKLARTLGAKRLEGYPVRHKSEGRIPAVFAWTGVPPLFERQNFVNISLPGSSRDIYVKHFR